MADDLARRVYDALGQQAMTQELFDEITADDSHDSFYNLGWPRLVELAASTGSANVFEMLHQAHCKKMLDLHTFFGHVFDTAASGNFPWLLDWLTEKNPDVSKWRNITFYNVAKKFQPNIYCSWLHQRESVQPRIVQFILSNRFNQTDLLHIVPRVRTLGPHTEFDTVMLFIAVASRWKKVLLLFARDREFVRRISLGDCGFLLRLAKKKKIIKCFPRIGLSRSDFVSVGVPWPC